MDNFAGDEESSNPTQHDVQNPHVDIINITLSTTLSDESLNSTSKTVQLRLALVLVAVAGAAALSAALGFPSARNNSVATQADSPDTPKPETSQYLTTDNPLTARMKMASSSIVNGYENCSDLEQDIREVLEIFMNKFIHREVITGEMYVNCDPNNEDWYSDLYGDDYNYIDYHDDEEYYYDYDSSRACSPAGNSSTCTSDDTQIPWVVTWIVSDHANGELFFNESEARAAYDKVDSTLAKRLYDPSMTAVDEYGWMEAHYWCQLETWAHDAQCDGEAKAAPVYQEKGSKSSKQNKATKSSKHTKSSISVFEKKTRARIPRAQSNSHIPESEPKSSSGEPENSFGQNSQKGTVNEEDKVVSDGTFIYAAYGDVLYAWPAADSTQGVSITRMPENATECEWNATKPCTYRSKPNIHALLLGKSRLIVILSQATWEYPLVENPNVPIIVHFHQGKYYMRVYDTSGITLGSPLKEVGRMELTGDYLNGRSVGDKAIILTASYVYHFSFTEVLLRHQPQYCGLDNASYEELATKTAKKQVESVAKQLVAEIELINDCSRIVQTFMMQKSPDELDEDMPDIGADFLRFFQVSMFDMSSDFDVDSDSPLTVAGVFAPGISNSLYLEQIYLDDDFLAVPSDVYTNANMTSSNTFIVGFDLSTEDGAIPYCYGLIPGTLDNSYRMDKWDGHLRIVTSDQSDVAEVNWTLTNVHKIYVLEIPRFEDGPGEMQIVGETILSADQDGYIDGSRFVQDVAFISTSPGNPELSSQFVIVDLLEHMDPHVAGSLKIDGSLSYMQPIVIDDISYILGVGYDYSTWHSFKIFLIDISNPSSPKVTTTYKDAIESYTESITDFLSFRYLPESSELVIPFSNNVNYTNGFAVYDILRNSISTKFKVMHSEIPSPCYFDAEVPPRSFIHQSELTTIRGHTAIRTDMHSGRLISELDLDLDFNYSDCSNLWSDDEL
eukprot:CCRYP_002229-RA/>CCRYP_002229-RA protein AED:0.36 eAED:0.36 QI:188/0.66/0.25/1/0.66/0.5/4/0/955